MSAAPSPQAGHRRRVTVGRSGDDAARRAARLLAEHPERPWRLPDLAEAVHLSPSQLERVFHRDVGMSPLQYLTRVRAHRLAHLLAATDLPIGLAMERVGWHARGHAARHFTAVMGMTPSEFRRRRESAPQTP